MRGNKLKGERKEERKKKGGGMRIESGNRTGNRTRIKCINTIKY